MAETLIVRGSRTGLGLLLVGMSLSLGARVWFADHAPGGGVPWWDWAFLAPAAVAGLLGFAFIIHPPRIEIDDEGATYSQIGYRLRINWKDVERIDVAQRSPDIASKFFRSAATSSLYGPRIGIDYKPGRNPIKDAGTAAYRRGIFGCDVALRTDFEHSGVWIVERMNERLEAARRL